MTARLNETRFGPNKKSSPIYLGPKNLNTLMHWMSVKLSDNFQMREHSWPCRFHTLEIWICGEIRIFSSLSCRIPKLRDGETNIFWLKQIQQYNMNQQMSTNFYTEWRYQVSLLSILYVVKVLNIPGSSPFVHV